MDYNDDPHTDPDASLRHEGEEEEAGPNEPAPGDLHAGVMVVYHLQEGFSSDEDQHRCAVVTRVYARDPITSGVNEEVGNPNARRSGEEIPDAACIDLTVFLASGDDPGRTYPMMAAKDVQYNPDCPPGTFCLITDGDDLPTVDDIRNEQKPDNGPSPLKGKAAAKRHKQQQGRHPQATDVQQPQQAPVAAMGKEKHSEAREITGQGKKNV